MSDHVTGADLAGACLRLGEPLIQQIQALRAEYGEHAAPKIEQLLQRTTDHEVSAAYIASYACTDRAVVQLLAWEDGRRTGEASTKARLRGNWWDDREEVADLARWAYDAGHMTRPVDLLALVSQPWVYDDLRVDMLTERRVSRAIDDAVDRRRAA